MTFTKTTLTAALALAALTTSSAKADTYRHIDTLAVKMQAQSRELLKEVTLHYSHKAGYRHLRSDAIQFYRVATHIHTVAHHSGDVHHLRNDLKKADRLFHHLEQVLEQTDLSFHGHNHGNTNHVFRLMHGLETNLHHLKRDIDQLDNAAHDGHGAIGLGNGGFGNGGFGNGGFGNGHGGHGGHGIHQRPSIGFQVGNGRVTVRNSGWSFRFGH
jgi:hypothetical protein